MFWKRLGASGISEIFLMETVSFQSAGRSRKAQRPTKRGSRGSANGLYNRMLCSVRSTGSFYGHHQYKYKNNKSPTAGAFHSIYHCSPTLTHSWIMVLWFYINICKGRSLSFPLSFGWETMNWWPTVSVSGLGFCGACRLVVLVLFILVCLFLCLCHIFPLSDWLYPNASRGSSTVHLIYTTHIHRDQTYSLYRIE